MFKQFFLKKLIQSKLKNLPADQQEKILAVVGNNPELFAKIGKEIQEKVKGGQDQQSATLQVMFKYQNELKKAAQ
ncbi:MAG: hypothetical protein HY455_03585 [Parcubacteria group bacterium]|nr:hypothetical protein [Parcubacteria group bacterium]